MRPRFAGALLVAAFAGAGAAQAGQLTMATWTQVVEGLPVSRTYTTAPVVDNTFLVGSVTSISVSLSYPQLTVSGFVPKTSMFPISRYVRVTQGGGPQHITATAGMVGASGSIPGAVLVKTAVHPTMGVDASMHQIGINTLLQVPLNMGRSSQFLDSYLVIFGNYHQLTVDFYGWTLGTQTFTGLTSRGEALPDVIAMGSWDLSPVNPLHHVFGGAGTVTLVSPARITIDGPLSRRTVSLTTLKLSFVSDGPYDTIPVPEPGALLLVGASAAALALLYGKTR